MKKSENINLEKFNSSTDKLAKQILKNFGPYNGAELKFLRQYYKVRQADVAQWLGFTQAAISQMEKPQGTTHTRPIWYALYCFFAVKSKREIISYAKYLKLKSYS